MATRTQVRTSDDINQMLATWSGLLQSSSDVGDAMPVQGAIAIAVSILSGTLGAGGAITWQGSLDGTNWFTLTSDIGAPAAIVQTTLNAVVMVKERPRFIRPNVTAGDGTTTLVAAANMVRQAQ